jgi:5-methylcytosine-specific restriction enzyme A
MTEKKRITGEMLNAFYKLGATQARYREDGTWYHPLRKFPGVLFDARGYVRFDTRREYDLCTQVKKGPDANHIHIAHGISTIPNYVPLPAAPLTHSIQSRYLSLDK